MNETLSHESRLEKFHWHTREEIFKYRAEDYERGLPPYETEVHEGNLALNEGLNLLADLLCGAGGTAYNNANTYIGVGDSNTAAEASQTGLQAASNKTWKGMDDTYPTSGSSQQVVFQATFGTSDANYAWEERTVGNSNDDSGENLLRIVSSKGTKQNTDTWVSRITLTFS
jgi:hypothetical protein